MKEIRIAQRVQGDYAPELGADCEETGILDRILHIPPLYVSFSDHDAREGLADTCACGDRGS